MTTPFFAALEGAVARVVLLFKVMRRNRRDAVLEEPARHHGTHPFKR